MDDYATFIGELRTWAEDKHPRGGKGTTTGGQFVAKNSGQSSSQSKTSSKGQHSPANHAVAKHSNAKGHQESGGKADVHKALAHAQARVHALESEVKRLRKQLHGHGGSSQSAKGAVHHAHPQLQAGAKNDPKRVKELQQLLKQLKIGSPHTNGEYGKSTEDAVKEVQKRLGMSPTGHASETLINKIRAAKALSPCLHGGGKRSDESAVEERSLMHVFINGICQMCEGEE